LFPNPTASILNSDSVQIQHPTHNMPRSADLCICYRIIEPC